MIKLPKRRSRYVTAREGIALHRSLPACVYILDTGRRRPCPAGDGCTEFTPLPGAEERRRRAAAAMWRGIRARPDGGAGDGR